MRRLRDEPNDGHDVDEDIPLHHKKPFGSGLKRQRVEFVRATESDNGVTFVGKPETKSTAGDLYASIVLGNHKPKPDSAPATRLGTQQTHSASSSLVAETASTCPVCSLPIMTSIKEHEASVAHQVKMPHAHPPSALDRSRMGLRALESLGWDPDARRGLGREGEGVRYPIKGKAKDDTLGVGARVADKAKKQELPLPPRKLTSKELKAAVARDKQRAERLQAEIYGRIDIESYLGRTMDE
ncbi:hypothetical protein E4U39_002195 [Claviceps sp. Clav50 group G5]|nr:hypothetical protein E4U39_002195 [Claviceps sp. Clav50 group G5]